jgi:hypothetical protein
MDNEHLKKYFPLEASTDPDLLSAQSLLRDSGHQLASTINRLVIEGQAKNEMLMRLLHLLKDVDLALQLDGPSRVKNLVVMN